MIYLTNSTAKQTPTRGCNLHVCPRQHAVCIEREGKLAEIKESEIKDSIH